MHDREIGRILAQVRSILTKSGYNSPKPEITKPPSTPLQPLSGFLRIAARSANARTPRSNSLSEDRSPRMAACQLDRRLAVDTANITRSQGR